jgi:hypothetical protein
LCVGSKKKVTDESPLRRLCRTAGAQPDQQTKLLAAYEFLAVTIRNRDAHAYVPNVRDAHHFLVADLFADCFNFLVSWLLPDGAVTLNEWNEPVKLKE